MSLERERNLLKGLNQTRRWATKINRMSDAQVVAMLERLKTQIKELRNIA